MAPPCQALFWVPRWLKPSYSVKIRRCGKKQNRRPPIRATAFTERYGEKLKSDQYRSVLAFSEDRWVFYLRGWKALEKYASPPILQLSGNGREWH
jgi:hypothetical protein